MLLFVLKGLQSIKHEKNTFTAQSSSMLSTLIFFVALWVKVRRAEMLSSERDRTKVSKAQQKGSQMMHLTSNVRSAPVSFQDCNLKLHSCFFHPQRTDQGQVIPEGKECARFFRQSG